MLFLLAALCGTTGGLFGAIAALSLSAIVRALSVRRRERWH